MSHDVIQIPVLRTLNATWFQFVVSGIVVLALGFIPVDLRPIGSQIYFVVVIPTIIFGFYLLRAQIRLIRWLRDYKPENGEGAKHLD